MTQQHAEPPQEQDHSEDESSKEEEEKEVIVVVKDYDAAVMEDSINHVLDGVSPHSSPWERVKMTYDWFSNSQLLAHVLMITTLFTFGGFCVLAPNPIRTMQPPIFAFVRSCLIVIIMLILSLVLETNYSFRSQRELTQYSNPIWRFIMSKLPKSKDLKTIVFCGSMFMLNQVFFVLGMNMTGATIAGIMQPLGKFFSIHMIPIMQLLSRCASFQYY